MRILLMAALSALPVAVPSLVAPVRFKAWQWQRVIRPAVNAPAAEQCVVLDGDLYAASAPGLRDIRLLQNGQEVAYALQESYDEGASRSVGSVDRAVYTTVLSIPLSDIGRLQVGTAVLPQHVPVERIELLSNADQRAVGLTPIPASHGRIHLRLVATPSGSEPSAGEVIEDDLEAANPLERTAIGANLQHSAHVDVSVDGGGTHVSSILLQMHQRSLCYQPLYAAPLLLLYGNADAPPVRYAYAAHYQPRAQVLLSSLEPAQRNANYQPRLSSTFALSRRQRLVLALLVAALCFMLTVVPLLRRR